MGIQLFGLDRGYYYYGITGGNYYAKCRRGEFNALKRQVTCLWPLSLNCSVRARRLNKGLRLRQSS